jgi:hypothetical protein
MEKPDIVAIDSETPAVLVVEVKYRVSPKDEDYFIQQLRDYAEAMTFRGKRYFALADQKQVKFYEDRDDRLTFIASVPTQQLNVRYARGEANSEGALASVVMAWLQDLAVQWKDTEAPGELPQNLRAFLKRARLGVA